MSLTELPLVFALVGLVLYTVLAGADFGAGIWQLTAGSGPAGERIREHTHHAMAPVWEANHVWLIFVLTVVWTAYPVAFGSIASTLVVPLFLASVGIIARGTTYALHAGAGNPAQRRRIDTAFAASSVLTPFALGTVVGGIASGRVPVGNAAGNLLSSWLNPTSMLLGVLAVSVAAFLAAAFLAADAARQRDPELELPFRRRAIGAGVLTGVLALAGVGVVGIDSPPLFAGLVRGPGLVGVGVSAVAGLATLALVARRRFAVARYTAPIAVGAIIAGWALAQHPMFLPGLTIGQAAAGRDTLIAVVVAVLAGAVLLFPSLALLFRLVLRGRFDPAGPIPIPAGPTSDPAGPTPDPAEPLPTGSTPARSTPARSAPVGELMPPARRGFGSRGLARAASAFLIAGLGLLTIAEAGWAHALGVVCLLAVLPLGFLAADPAKVADATPEHQR